MTGCLPATDAAEHDDDEDGKHPHSACDCPDCPEKKTKFHSPAGSDSSFCARSEKTSVPLFAPVVHPAPFISVPPPTGVVGHET